MKVGRGRYLHPDHNQIHDHIDHKITKDDVSLCSREGTTMRRRGVCDLVIDVTGDRDVIAPSSALPTLADRVRRLAPSHRNLHRFHEDKSEIVHDLEQLAREVRQ